MKTKNRFKIVAFSNDLREIESKFNELDEDGWKLKHVKDSFAVFERLETEETKFENCAICDSALMEGREVKRCQ